MEGKETQYYTRKTLLIAFVVGVLVGFGGYYLWDKRDAVHTIPEEKEEGGAMENERNGALGENQGSNPHENYTISVSDQTAGLKVEVSNVDTPEKVWLAVYESNAEGQPSSILGAYRVDAGSHTNVSIPLLRNTEEGGTYYVMFHSDNGDDEFDHTVDTSIRDAADRPLMGTFSTIRVR